MAPLFCLFIMLNVFVLTVHAADDAEEYAFSVADGNTNIHTTGYDSPLDPVSQKDHHILPEHKHSRKFQTNKHITLKVVMPVPESIQPVFVAESVVKVPRIPEKYSYQFYKEINPPPPKA